MIIDLLQDEGALWDALCEQGETPTVNVLVKCPDWIEPALYRINLDGAEISHPGGWDQIQIAGKIEYSELVSLEQGDV